MEFVGVRRRGRWRWTPSSVLTLLYFLCFFCLCALLAIVAGPEAGGWRSRGTGSPVQGPPETRTEATAAAAAAAAALEGARRRSTAAMTRRYLVGPGSYPPRCVAKCGDCNPCKPVHVPVPPGTPVITEYYPEAWRCKCGGKLYTP